MKNKKYFAIIGRVPEHENMTLLLEAANRKSAIIQFERQLYAFSGESRPSARRIHGVSSYIVAILESDTPIRINPL